MKRYTLYITNAEFDALRKLSDQTEIAVAEIVRRALDRYLATPEMTMSPTQPTQE